MLEICNNVRPPWGYPLFNGTHHRPEAADFHDRSTHTIGWWSTWICPKMSRRRRERCRVRQGMAVSRSLKHSLSMLLISATCKESRGLGLGPANLGHGKIDANLTQALKSICWALWFYGHRPSLGDVQSPNPRIVALLWDFGPFFLDSSAIFW